MYENILELYADYLIAGSQQAKATELSKVTGWQLSHDKVTRFLAGKGSRNKYLNGRELWLKVKPMIRGCETEEGCLIFDDTIIAKPYMDEGEIIQWYYDHKDNKTIKGIDLLSAFYWVEDTGGESVHLPVDYKIIAKTEKYKDKATGKEKVRSKETKNEMLREMVQRAVNNELKFKYVLADSWFSSVENMDFIKELGKIFIFELKLNRVVALSEEDKKQGKYISLKELAFPEGGIVQVWLKGLPFAVNLRKQVFKNKDGSTGQRILASNDLSMTAEQFATLYKRRWSVEEYHKSLKENVGIGKSPAHTKQTQSNHVFASIYAYVKLEVLRLKEGLNHFAIKSQIYSFSLKIALRHFFWRDFALYFSHPKVLF